MGGEKKRVLLAQVNHTYGRSCFLPYSVGMLQAYAQAQPDIAEAYEFLPLVFLREDPAAIIARTPRPNVLGLSSYIWNEQWNLAMAKAARRAWPDCLIVFGGPQVPENRAAGYLDRYPCVDLLVHNEGEITFAEILRKFTAWDHGYHRLPGVSGRAGGTQAVRIADLSTLPSPYLSGVFNSMPWAGYDFHAIQESHRGCPYLCSFCDWGSATYTKVRQFDDKRLQQELHWVGQHDIELLYNADANYGLLPRDVALTNYLSDTKAFYGFPKQFRAAYAKNTTDRVFQIAKTLNDAGMSKGVTLSLQSTDPHTLEVIKRKNIAMDDFESRIRQYTEAGIGTYTELILGLPGETYDSFCDGIDRILRAGQHHGLYVYLCMALPNSEMSDPAYIKEHGIETVCGPLLQQHATPDPTATEMADIVIGTRTMPLADWRRAFMFAWAVQTFHCLPTGTMVSTDQGAKPIESVTSSDRILSWNKERAETEWSRCAASICQGVRQTYKVEYDGGEIEATSDHKLLTERGWRAVSALRPGDRLLLHLRDEYGPPASRPQKKDVLPRMRCDQLQPSQEGGLRLWTNRADSMVGRDEEAGLSTDQGSHEKGYLPLRNEGSPGGKEISEHQKRDDRTGRSRNFFPNSRGQGQDPDANDWRVEPDEEPEGGPAGDGWTRRRVAKKQPDAGSEMLEKVGRINGDEADPIRKQDNRLFGLKRMSIPIYGRRELLGKIQGFPHRQESGFHLFGEGKEVSNPSSRGILAQGCQESGTGTPPLPGCWLESFHDLGERATRVGSGEQVAAICCWRRVRGVSPSGQRNVYDIVGVSPNSNFFADGILVHNCLGLTTEIAIAAFEQTGLSYRAFYEKLLEYAFDHPHNVIGREATRIADLCDAAVGGAPWGTVIPQFGPVVWPAEEASFLRLVDQLDAFYWHLIPFLAHHLRFIGPFQSQVQSVVRPDDPPFNGDRETYARDVLWYNRKTAQHRQKVVA